MRRLSSSSWLSRPVEPTDNTASDMTMAMITSTTKISTSVKPLLRMPWNCRAPHLFIRRGGGIEGGGADIRVEALTAGFAVPAVGGDVILTAVGARTGVYIHIAPRVLRKRLQVSIRIVIRETGIRGLLDQGLQALFGRGVLKVIEPVEVEGRLNGPNVALRPLDLGNVDFIYDLRHHERAQNGENDHDDHDLDKGKTAFAFEHNDL